MQTDLSVFGIIRWFPSVFAESPSPCPGLEELFWCFPQSSWSSTQVFDQFLICLSKYTRRERRDADLVSLTCMRMPVFPAVCWPGCLLQRMLLGLLSKVRWWLWFNSGSSAPFVHLSSLFYACAMLVMFLWLCSIIWSLYYFGYFESLN